MTSTLLLRIASIYMFVRLVAQLFLAYKIPASVNASQNYLWQPSDLIHNHEFFYWGFCIAFALVGRLLWVVSMMQDKKENIGMATIEGAIWFLLALGIAELVYKFYFSGTATLLCSILAGISYFKIKGLSIKITYDSNSEN